MNKAISLFYGNEIETNIEFCEKNDEVIMRYAHGIMTLQGSPYKIIKKVANNPLYVPGWEDSLKERPSDVEVLKEFFQRIMKWHDERSWRFYR